MAAEREQLLQILEDLTAEEFRKFVFHLESIPDRSVRIPRGKLEKVSPVELAELLARYFPGKELEVAAHALEKIPRRDILRDLLRDVAVGDRPSGRETPAMEASVGLVEAAPAQSSQVVSQQQLMKLARKLGRKWKTIAIEFLGVENSRLEQIEEENHKDVVMQAFYMLWEWRNREGGRATAANLYLILNQDGVNLDHDAYAFLRERVP
ncbi:apoptosis-associated speck-like protein containing a CARD [Lacerta agilis]|uniref:apoptosis-associated speck-like protein containing a CARD n=1 Tax=Lacerta agilis TaxID=80427 RepID=UPI001419F8AC|nr:apoptosis-associated speck-like protein containing a CARD [Lacerta agilis]